MMQIRSALARALALAVCMMLALLPACGEGLRFSLRADVEPSACPEERQALLAGIDELLAAAQAEGTLFVHEGCFDVEADLLLGEGRGASRTGIHLYGLDSHWGLRSSLLGDTELMINVSALLPFGQKTMNWLGIPLDKAALLVPYVHTDALRKVSETLQPLFPETNGSTRISRSRLDDMARELLRLSEEDAALERWLEVTGLRPTFEHALNRFLTLPEIALPWLTVTRTDSALKWDVYLLNILTIRLDAQEASLSLYIPTMAEAQGTLRSEQDRLTGSVHASIGSSLRADAAFAFPASPSSNGEIAASVDAHAPFLPEDGLVFSLSGALQDGALTLRLLDREAAHTILTVSGNLSPATPASQPHYTPADLTGVNVLSVNGDSLQALMGDVAAPLLSGLLDLLAAAPAQAVQTLMDALEDTGMIDLLADALSGGSGY